MKIQEIIAILEQWAPKAYAEDFDNVGLLVGDQNQECKGVLITHDVLENVVAEAIEKKFNLIVTFHPIIFSGLKKITGKSYVEKVVAKAVKNERTPSWRFKRQRSHLGRRTFSVYEPLPKNQGGCIRKKDLGDKGH